MTGKLFNFLNNKNQKLTSFFLATLVFILFQEHKNIIYFPSDSGDYWKLSSGNIFINFPKDSFRGYFFPMLLWPAHWLTDVLQLQTPHAYRIYAAIIYAYAFTIIFPFFYIKIFGGAPTALRRLITPFITVLLFPGIILYPLSDLPSFILISISITTLFTLKNQPITILNCAKIASAGFLAYGAYNTRTIYLFPLIGIFLWFPLHFGQGMGFFFKLLMFLFLIAGGSLASAPQVIINFKNYNKLSPFVQAKASEKSLFALQLMWGITIQRYSTFLISPQEGAGIYAMDPAGVQIFEKEKLTPEAVGIKKYLQLFTKHPQFFAGAYARHIINGFDIRDGEIYSIKPYAFGNLKSLCGFLVMFFFGLVVYSRTDKPSLERQDSEINISFSSLRNHADKFWPVYLLLTTLPVIAIVPGAIESRFFLPMQLLIYLTLGLNGETSEVLALIKNKFGMVFLLFALSLSLFFAISHSTISMETKIIDQKYLFKY